MAGASQDLLVVLNLKPNRSRPAHFEESETSVQVTGAVATEELASRYGRTRSRSRRNRWLFLTAAAAFVAVFVAWVLWAGLDQDTSSLEATDTGYTIVDQHHVRLTFEINVAPGTPVTCALEALDEQFAVIGWKVVSYPGTGQRLTTHTETVRTTERANTGLIYRCRLA
jgi:hypothetical protein